MLRTANMRQSGILLLFLVSLAGAQSAAPGFDVVSVKPTDSAPAVSIVPQRSGNRIRYVTTVPMIVYFAYHVQPFQVAGELPSGMYDIEAITHGQADEAQLRVMFQSLLEDRFRLKTHREVKESKVFNLVVDKKGPKLMPATADPEVRDGKPIGGVGIFVTTAGPQLEGKNASTAQLAEAISRVFKIPVVDKTGLDGRYDFRVAMDGGADAGEIDRVLVLTAALKDNLGLRVESARGTTEIIVIDHAEKPAAN